MACSSAVRLGHSVRVRFSVWLSSGYAHVIVLVSVVTEGHAVCADNFRNLICPFIKSSSYGFHFGSSGAAAFVSRLICGHLVCLKTSNRDS